MATKNEKKLMEQFRNKCKEYALRVTPQRVVIYKELLKSRDHPTSEKLFNRLKRAFPELSFDTVYRTLSIFSEIGLVDLVEGYGTAMRFDPELENHHHFRCKKCGTITDISFKQYDELVIPKDIARECEVLKLQVSIDGFCEKCRKRTKT